MSLRLFFGAVETGAFKNNVNADLSPRKIFCIFHCIDFDGLAVNGDGIFTRFNGVSSFADLAAVAALSGIVLKKMSKHFRIGKVVDRNYLVALCAEHLSERKTTDTAEAVNSNFN